MNTGLSMLRAGAAICGACLLFVVPAHSGTNCGGGCSVVLDRSVQVFQASGPVSLLTGQNAGVCATNLDSSPVFVLIALIQADNGTLLGSRQDQLAPGGGTCLNFTRSPQSNAQTSNVLGLVIPNGRLTELGSIVQDRPGSGGCIAASLQIQSPAINNVSQTFLYVPMKDFRPGN